MALKFHHVNLVAENVDRLHDFYVNVLGLDSMAQENFPRTAATEDTGYSGEIRFATDGETQLHLAERQFDVAFKNSQVINPVERGHIAFRTDDLAPVLAALDAAGIPYSDYGTTFSAEWRQVFFLDPEGNVVEVHEQVATVPHG